MSDLRTLMHQYLIGMNAISTFLGLRRNPTRFMSSFCKYYVDINTPLFTLTTTIGQLKENLTIEPWIMTVTQKKVYLSTT